MSKKLFNLHCDLPFLPEKKRKSKIVTSMLVPYRIRKQCCAYKSLKTGVKSWINI